MLSSVFLISALCSIAAVRESERRKKDVYQELPLFEIEQRFGGTEGGKKLGLRLVKTIELSFRGEDFNGFP